MPRLYRITLKGFKSIKELDDFELGGINILVGANGAGKSNLAAFLLHMRETHPSHYARIADSIRLVAPFFDGWSAPNRRSCWITSIRSTW